MTRGPGSGPTVVVVGGGLAGLSAALESADAGARVTLLERRHRLGGLTWSFEHRGRMVDNGQHVFLRCCEAYLGFLERIGAADDVELQDRLDVTALDAGGPGGEPSRGRLHRNDLPAPLQLGWSLLRYRHLTPVERLRLGRAVLPLRRADLRDPALDQETFAGWLRRHGQSDHAIANLWDLICVATVNLPSSEASAAVAAMVFQVGLLTDPRAADIGWSRVPLGELHGRRAGEALAAAGVSVELGQRVRSVERLGSGGLRVVTDEGDHRADAVVVALPHHAVAEVLPPGAVPGQERLARLGTSPIVNVHVTFDRPVTDLPLVAALGGVVHWVFDRTASSGLARSGDGGQYLAVTISAADRQLGQRPDELAPAVVDELRGLFPAARKARVVDTLVTKERAATFRATPGTAALRPGPLTAVPGLVLAGAWTDTGWPATMEGAVRSGRAAAHHAVAGAGQTRLLPEEVA